MQNALLIGLVVALVWFVEKMCGTPMVNRPLIISTLVGLVLGNLKLGVMIGASLELVFMGAIQVGAAVPPDILVGASLGTAFAIISGKGPAVALTLALPISLLSQSLKVIIFIVRSWFMKYAVKMAQHANVKGMHCLNFFGLILQCLMYFIVVFVALLFGSSAVTTFVNAIPQVIMNGLTVAGNLLPAVGFGLLLMPMMTKKNFLYFLLGFLMIAYGKMPILAVTLFGVILAFVVVFEFNKSDNNKHKNDTNEKSDKDNGVEDLFDA
ncbi:PTS sugar transporter subunit IIC [Lactobacillus sp. ESL0259]|uniref:PTS mannose/fructose/sorbose/N-acetylgalactosamine transporter subunit IIC n=1 Tax=Lactobacillus sp. ESL0259 TaxID=2069346 RepID=UPI000EFA54C5|nr:PTS sugar transporter subunit IIC [Lactobacillus sp. ESL0259]RMC61464.1 PTS sugar transporter subunit IIC [Lactobacillus sp. ESL0259]